mmetsp:Transcript_24109/g.76396  ORF Transcript_24109/g.76396 Transcript_24109/m.76396 type:complete len:96 (-) Transcript_24109:97-384(-)
MQVLLPEGAQLMGPMGPVPMPDGMQGQAAPMPLMPLPGHLPTDEGLPATPSSGEATPSPFHDSEDVLAQRMEMLRMKLQGEEQLQMYQEQQLDMY